MKHSQPLISKFQEHDIVFAALFGSRASRSHGATSDFDFLVEFEPSKRYTLIDIASLKNSLEEMLDSQVDIVTTKALNPHLKNTVLSNLQIIYDQRSGQSPH